MRGRRLGIRVRLPGWAPFDKTLFAPYNGVNERIALKTCRLCEHFLGSTIFRDKGLCYLNPPVPDGSFSRRPEVTKNEKGCSYWEPIWSNSIEQAWTEFQIHYKLALDSKHYEL